MQVRLSLIPFLGRSKGVAKKRGNNEGTIHKLPNGKWRAQVTLEDCRLGHVFNTRGECQEWIRKLRNQIDDGLTYASTRQTLSEYMQSWLVSIKAAKRRSTWVQYDQVTRSYIMPNLGHLKVKDIRPEHIQGMYNRLLEQGAGVYTILKIHTVLHGALQRAVKTGMIGRNPASFTQPPKEPANEMAILNESQVSQLFVAAIGHRWEALYHLAVVTGMRQMELLGLKWTDLDWVRQTIKVERQLAKPAGEGVKFTAPKTRFGRRTVTLGGRTIDVLRGHYERQQAERVIAGDKWNVHDLIFTTGLGGPIHPRNLLRDFKKLLQTAGLPEIRFHGLRHTAASLLLNNGIPPIIVSRRLGHARTSITLDVYGHLIPSMQVEAAEKIDELVTPIPLHTVAHDIPPEPVTKPPYPHI